MEDKDLQNALLNLEFKTDNDSEKLKTILEQYRLYVDMADKISVRRQTSNSFFLSLSVALMAALGYLIEKNYQIFSGYLWVVPLFGILISYDWFHLIQAYRKLNSGKFKIIHLLEQHLPVKPYDAEWKAVGEGKNKKQYLPFTHIETFLPLIFLFSFVVVMLLIIPWKYILCHQ